jgi:ornithine cyclodeaminase/alanine dehydrogenase
MSELLMLSRADVARLMDYPAYVEAVEAALRAAWQGKALAPPAAGFSLPDGSYHAKGAALLGDTVAIKLNANYPGNPASNGLPTVQGVIYLADARNGCPLALMDSIEITINRTGAATTIAARHLARPESKVATICGAGVQGRIQARAIAEALSLDRINVWDIRPEAAQALATDLMSSLGIDVRPTPDLAVTRQSDVIVACSSARKAYLTSELVRAGTFIAAIGADNHDKQEIDPLLFPRATVVVDSLEQCAEIGDLHHALKAGAITPDRVHASLAELVSGNKRGRQSINEIALFDSTGMGLQDVAAAAAVYRRAIARGAGTRFAIN